MRQSIISGFCVAVIGVVIVTMGVAHAGPKKVKTSEKNPAGMSQVDRQDQEIREKLKKKIDVDFVEVPLNEVILVIRERTGIQCILDNRAIEDLGYSPDMPITVNLKGLPAESVLRIMLKDMELSYYVEDGVLAITTQEVLDSRFLVRMYDVRTLIGNHGPWNAYPMISMGPNGPSRAGKTKSPVETNRQELCSLIKKVVEPRSWQPAGGFPQGGGFGAGGGGFGGPGMVAGDAGTLSIYRGILVVRQTESVHAEIEKLLDQLRDKLKNAPPETNYPTPPTITPTPMGAPGGMMPGMGGMGMGGGMMGAPSPPPIMPEPESK